jgi:hypothetical protein
MCKAKLTKKENFDGQYGPGIEYTFMSDQIGEYKTKKKNDEDKYYWLSELPIGATVDLVKNPQGKGYYINKIKDESKAVFETMKENDTVDKTSNTEKLTKSADFLANCVKSMKCRLPELPIDEQIKLGISLFIQISK